MCCSRPRSRLSRRVSVRARSSRAGTSRPRSPTTCASSSASSTPSSSLPRAPTAGPHRGGPPGFLKPIGTHTLAFADFAGNRQYITLGHLRENDRAHIFIPHFATQQRVKLWGRARVVEGDRELMERLVDPTYKARPERAVVFSIEAWDINCRQHITPRYSEAEIAPAIDRLAQRIKELEAEVERLKAGS
jgi:predicted pyridoxine 5'-phosphate oxidase superfamily flavin-nucleotide-binding protein